MCLFSSLHRRNDRSKTSITSWMRRKKIFIDQSDDAVNMMGFILVSLNSFCFSNMSRENDAACSDKICLSIKTIRSSIKKLVRKSLFSIRQAYEIAFKVNTKLRRSTHDRFCGYLFERHVIFYSTTRSLVEMMYTLHGDVTFSPFSC